MTSISAPTVKDQEFVSIGLVESASVNSFSDFVPSKFNNCELNTEKENDDFINSFICHLIFYAFFCVSIVLHILIDFGLGSFIKKKFVQFMGIKKKRSLGKTPSFA